jgi:hypothetical protein
VIEEFTEDIHHKDTVDTEDRKFHRKATKTDFLKQQATKETKV